MDRAGALWIVWEVEGNFAHAIKVPPARGEDDEAIWTKQPIRFDWLESQLEEMGLPAANESEWRAVPLETALKIREIAAA